MVTGSKTTTVPLQFSSFMQIQLNLVFWPVYVCGRGSAWYREDIGVYLYTSVCDSRNRVNHVEPHLHTAVGMVCLGLGQSRHTVVTVPQDLYPPAVILLQREMDRCYLKHPTSTRDDVCLQVIFRSIFAENCGCAVGSNRPDSEMSRWYDEALMQQPHCN